MPSQEYNYCKDNIESINAGSNDNLKLFCANVIEAYESKIQSITASAQNYYCANSGTNVGMKLFRQQEGVLNIVAASTYKVVNQAYLPAITVCNQNLY